MPYDAKFKGWKELTLEDLIVAYRKAKADCYYEDTFPTALKFANYEQNLISNLEKLLINLRRKDALLINKKYLGQYRLYPKKVSKTKRAEMTQEGHVHISNPKRSLYKLVESFDITPEFRIIGDFPVETHIISALWINMIGHKYDAKLKECCYGARLKRVTHYDLENEMRPSNTKEKVFHISAIGSFIPYFKPYQEWRNDGLKSMRNELEKNRNIIAVSLDIKSYYHQVDCLALKSKSLSDKLELSLSIEERKFTNQLAEFLNIWSEKTIEFGKNILGSVHEINGGLPIGLTCSRIISNVLLHYWDKLVLERLTPIHYGRYVDDMFIVIRDPGTVTNNNELMKLFQNRIGKTNFTSTSDGEIWQIKQGSSIQKGSKIELQASKQKMFILEGQAGLDLLDSIEKDIYELSSEHRLLPYPDELEKTTAAKVLSATENIGERADTLRRADGLTIKRLGWALQLRHVRLLAKDLPKSEWKSQRNEFYQFAYNHILKPDSIFTYFKYIPRLLEFAVDLNEWKQAREIANSSYDAINKLKDIGVFNNEVFINGIKTEVDSEKILVYLQDTLSYLLINSVFKSYPINELFQENPSENQKLLLNLVFKKMKEDLYIRGQVLTFDKIIPNTKLAACDILKADLAKISYKEILKNKSKRSSLDQLFDNNKNIITKIVGSKALDLIGDSGLINIESLLEFLNSTKSSRFNRLSNTNEIDELYLPYLFPTRPLTPSQIAELAPECVGLNLQHGNTKQRHCTVQPAEIWAKYTQALRGVWVKPTEHAKKSNNESLSKEGIDRFIRIGTDRENKVTIALTNILSEDSYWAASAFGKPQLTLERYQRFVKLVNSILLHSPRPDYVIFPELSVPLEWVDSIAAKLNESGINLIAGTEYRHLGNNIIQSEAVLSLSDNRLGYPSFCKIWQPKLEPAVGEDQELLSTYGKQWVKPSKKIFKPVYIHNGFHFSLMICSELQNSKERIKFQGNVDSLIVLSWNKDLETFSSLIESAALDIHAYTVLVNNRAYGDSRVRSPAKQAHMRDIARLRGGDNDFFVIASLDISSLRAFQSKAKRWPKDTDKFKPVPEGFSLCNSRNTERP